MRVRCFIQHWGVMSQAWRGRNCLFWSLSPFWQQVRPAETHHRWFTPQTMFKNINKLSMVIKKDITSHLSSSEREEKALLKREIIFVWWSLHCHINKVVDACRVMLVCNCKESCINCVNVKCLKLTLTLWSGWTVKYDRFRDDVSPGVFNQIKPSLWDVSLHFNYFCGKAQRLTTPTSAQALEFTQLPTQVTSSSSIVSPCSSMMYRVDK